MPLFGEPTYLFRVKLRTIRRDEVLANRLQQALLAAAGIERWRNGRFHEGTSARIAAGLPRLTFLLWTLADLVIEPKSRLCAVSGRFGEVAFWHFSDMADSADDVRCWGKSGSPILRL